jgi:hypothetical protein
MTQEQRTPEGMVEMLPCPFCGEKGDDNPTDDGRYSVGCHNPFCWFMPDISVDYEGLAEAIRRWNTRAAIRARAP